MRSERIKCTRVPKKDGFYEGIGALCCALLYGAAPINTVTTRRSQPEKVLSSPPSRLVCRPVGRGWIRVFRGFLGWSGLSAALLSQGRGVDRV